MSSSGDDPNLLALFNEKANELLSSSFFRKLDGGAIVLFDRTSGWDSVYVGSDEESIRAVVLTLRLFLQKNDPVSIRRIAELYNRLPLSEEVVTEFRGTKAELNTFLDTESPLSIAEGRRLTQREILEIFVYGTYAHTEKGKRKTFEALRQTPFFPLFQNALAQTIVGFARGVARIRDLNARAAAELAASRNLG